MMAFQTPNARQESQNRKILEELQQQKKMLMSNKQIPSTPAVPGQSSSGTQPVIQNQTSGTENHAMSQSQRAALQHAHDNCVGYYITQDSSFGNLILPVIPRFDTNGNMVS